MTLAVGLIGISAVLDDLFFIRVEVCILHAQRFENTLLRELLQRLAGNALDNLRRQRVPRVAIVKLTSRFEIQFLLPPNQAQNIALRDDVLHAPSAQSEQAPLIPKAASMLQ